MMKKVLLAAAVAFVGLLGLISAQPSEFEIKRSKTLTAPPEVVHNLLADLHSFARWSPWDKRDPGMKKTFEGPERGVGSSYAWNGNKDVGSGKMTITAVDPKAVKVKLEFLEPFAATNETIWATEADGAGTKVTWSMTGHNNFMSKAMGLVMNMDAMVGPDFEAGLNSLGDVATKAAAEQAAVEKKQAEEAAAAKAAAEAAAAPAPAADGAAPAAPAGH